MRRLRGAVGAVHVLPVGDRAAPDADSHSDGARRQQGGPSLSQPRCKNEAFNLLTLHTNRVKRQLGDLGFVYTRRDIALSTLDENLAK